MKIGIRDIHRFLTDVVPQEVIGRYRKFKLLNESDFSRDLTNRISRFLKREDDPTRLTVTNCLYCEPSNTYPDIVIRKRNKPWVVIELKEKKKLDAATLEAEKSKMLRQHKALAITKRGYFMYLARYGKHRLLKNKKEYRYWFYEVPITLERNAKMTSDEVAVWEKRFKGTNKFKAGS
jgi:hypothetical protein